MSRRTSITFARSQVAALAASVVDFGGLFLFTEIFHFWYVLSAAIGACLGAFTNFMLGRHWSFEVGHEPVQGQAFRYALVSAGSLALNVSGVWAVTELCHLPYGVSKLISAFLVGLVYNYPLHRFFVFPAKLR